MLKEVRFRYRHTGCWLQDTTSRHTDLTLVATSLYMSGDDVVVDVTIHAADRGSIERALQEWEAEPRIHRVTRVHEGPRGTRVQVTYDATGSIYPHIIQHTPITLGPVRFVEGTEFYQIIGTSPDLSKLLQDLGGHGELDVESVREADAPDVGTGWEGLTDKQRSILLTAFKAGYYQWPRGASAADIAKRLGLSSSAFLDHLRTAEAKLISAEVDAHAQTTGF